MPGLFCVCLVVHKVGFHWFCVDIQFLNSLRFIDQKVIDLLVKLCIFLNK